MRVGVGVGDGGGAGPEQGRFRLGFERRGICFGFQWILGVLKLDYCHHRYHTLKLQAADNFHQENQSRN